MDEWVNQNKSAIIIGVSIIAAALILAPKPYKYEGVPDARAGMYILDKSTGKTSYCLKAGGDLDCTK